MPIEQRADKTSRAGGVSPLRFIDKTSRAGGVSPLRYPELRGLTPPAQSFVPKSPSPPVFQGERGWGEGETIPKILAPHPLPLSPEYRGEG